MKPLTHYAIEQALAAWRRWQDLTERDRKACPPLEELTDIPLYADLQAAMITLTDALEEAGQAPSAEPAPAPEQDAMALELIEQLVRQSNAVLLVCHGLTDTVKLLVQQQQPAAAVHEDRPDPAAAGHAPEAADLQPYGHCARCFRPIHPEDNFIRYPDDPRQQRGFLICTNPECLEEIDAFIQMIKQTDAKSSSA